MKVHYETLRVSPLKVEAGNAVLTASIVEIKKTTVSVEEFKDGFVDDEGKADSFDLSFE